MGVVVLRLLVQVAIYTAAVDHAAAHGDGSTHDMLDEPWLTGMTHGIDAAFRHGQVNGFGEVEWRG